MLPDAGDLDDLQYVTPLSNPNEVGMQFAPVPKILNCPVVDSTAHLDEVGMVQTSGEMPLEDCLAPSWSVR